MNDCVFCRIVRHEDEAEFVAEVSGEWTVIVPLNPVTEGHVLVIPVEHQERFDQLSIAARQQLDYALAIYGRPLTSYNIIQSNGEAATQTIKHVHFHIVPRREDDGLMLPWSDASGALARIEGLEKELNRFVPAELNDDEALTKTIGGRVRPVDRVGNPLWRRLDG